MRRQRRGLKVLALIAGLSLVATACGGDDDDDDTGTDEEAVDRGGEIIDLQVFSGGGATFLDPATSSSVSESQIIGSLYDGLTQVDYSDPENPELKGLVAESWEPNEDNTVWTFTIREGLKFSDGTDVLPSSFKRGWERASHPDLEAAYAPLFKLIEGGDKRVGDVANNVPGDPDTELGVEADDEAMTLTVTLDTPYNSFDYLAGFKVFDPMPAAVDDLEDQSTLDRELMVGNGPFMQEEAWDGEDSDIVLVPNPEWDGTKYDEAFELPEQPYLDKITFKVTGDTDTAFASFEAGEADTALAPSGRAQEAADNYGDTLDTPILGVYYLAINQRPEDSPMSGPENKLLRQAISLAIDRDTINSQVFEDTRVTASGITPPGIPGYEEGMCEFCEYDPDAATQAFEDWQAEGNELTEPLKIQYNEGLYHGDAINIVIDNLKDVGIEAEGVQMPTEGYFDQLKQGACNVCRTGWIADYPLYENFTWDLFHSETIGGNNYGYTNEEFDKLVDDAKQTTDPEEGWDLYRQAEDILLNDDVGAIPLNYYRGTFIYNEDKIAEFTQEPTMHVVWETVRLKNP